VKNLLRISARLPVPLDETFVEEEPEEEEDICEIIDDEEEEEVEDTSNEFPGFCKFLVSDWETIWGLCSFHGEGKCFLKIWSYFVIIFRVL